MVADVRTQTLATLFGLAICLLAAFAVYSAIGRIGESDIDMAIDGGPTPAGTDASPARFGINLSGAEARGGDMIRPNLMDLKNAIDRQGFRLIRYPFKRDRMSPERIDELQVLTEYARSRGVPVILDNHSFAWPVAEDQITWWTAFARKFPDDGSILLDLNNEPKGVGWEQWGVEAKQVIAGLRRNGIRHPILLEWPGYSAISRFDKNEKAGKPCESAACALDRAPGRLDELNRTFLNGHRYFDSNSSGTSGSCTKRNGAVRTESGFGGFAAKLRKRGWQGYITESAFGSYSRIPESCAMVGTDAIADINENRDVLRGVAWWGAGRIWPDRYPFKIDCPKPLRFTCPLPDYVRMLRGSTDISNSLAGTQ